MKKTDHRRLLPLAVALSTIILPSFAQAGEVTVIQPNFTVVATAGDETDLAPTPMDAEFSLGVILNGFSTPALSDNDRVTTRATLRDRRKSFDAIYTVDSADDDFVPVYKGDEARDANGFSLEAGTYKSFSDPVLAPQGRMAFRAKLSGVPASQNEGIWSDVFGTGQNDIRLILQKGSEVPGFTGDETLKSVSSLSVREGQLLALIKLNPLRNVVTVRNDSALVLFTAADTATVLLQEGTNLGGVAGDTIKSFSVLQPGIGSVGQGRWHSTNGILAKVTLQSGEVRIVKIAADGTVTEILSTTDELNLGSMITSYQSFATPVLDPSGFRMAVAGALTKVAGEITKQNDDVLLFHNGVALSLIAREGQPLSGDDGAPLFSSFQDPAVNDVGRLAFVAGLKGPGVNAKNKSALFVGDGTGNPTVLARLGSEAPDLAGTPQEGVVFSKFVSYAVASGATGRVILLAEVKGTGVTKKNKLRLFAQLYTGNFVEILRNGASINDGPAVTSFSLLNALPGAFGVARSYNSSDSLVIQAKSAGGLQQLVRIDLPVNNDR